MSEKKVLIGVTGSVAAIKLQELVQLLLQVDSVKVELSVMKTQSRLKCVC